MTRAMTMFHSPFTHPSQRFVARHLVFVWSIAFASSVSVAALITIPTSLGPGDSYRLAFLTSTTRDAASSLIADYNTFVQTTADNVPVLQALGTTWKAVGSTASVDARDNTGTNPTVATGEPIFLLNDTILATSYSDLWDTTLAVPWNFTEIETTQTGFAWTGSNGFGLKDPFGLTLGSTTGVELGDVSSTTGSWIGAGFSPTNSGLQSFYAISGVLTVVPEPNILMCSIFAAGTMLAACARRSITSNSVRVADTL